MSLRIRPLALALAALVALPGAARADEDYNAPDPNRHPLTYVRAAASVTLENYVIFQIDWFRNVEWIHVTRDTIANNATSFVRFDYDPISEDFIAHPMHGTLHFNAARGAGLSFWESVPYTALGTAEWEILGERQEWYPPGWRSKPSTNDVLTTSTMGIVIGEILHRVSSEVLDDSTSGTERLFREIGASLVNPMRGIDRVTTGAAWKGGDRPVHNLRAGLDLGLDRLRIAHEGTEPAGPTALLAADFEYGDLLRKRRKSTLEPFELFQTYLAIDMAEGRRAGTQVYAQGLLFGWGSRTTDDAVGFRSNNVFGIAPKYDYVELPSANYGMLSVGPADYVSFRLPGERRLWLGADLGWTYLGSTNSPFAGTDHAYVMGGELGVSGALDLGAEGKLSLRTAQYLTEVIDGQGAHEIVDYGRLAYTVDVAPNVALGVAPMLVRHQSVGGSSEQTITSADAQLFVRLHN